jgi:hypothetical protein
MRDKLYMFMGGISFGLGVALVVICIAAMMSGCDALTQRTDEYCEANPGAPQSACWYHFPAQSWDQENLKKGDNTCRTMVFIAPGGNLEQCP